MEQSSDQVNLDLLARRIQYTRGAVAARLARTSPDSYAQFFDILEMAGIHPDDLARRMERMARFRKLLVHGC